MGFSIKAFFGGDTTQLRGELGALEGTVKDSFGKMAHHSEGGLADNVKGIHHAIRELHQFLLAGGLVEVVKHFFESTIEAAKKSTDATDENVAAVKRFGNSYELLKEGTASVAIAVLGFFNRAGEGWGMMINDIRGISKEQQKAADEIAQNTIETLERIAARRKAIEAQNTPEHLMAMERELAALREKNYESEFSGAAKIAEIKREIEATELRIQGTFGNHADFLRTEIKLEQEKAELKAAEEKQRERIKKQIAEETALLIAQAKEKRGADDSYEAKIVELGREHNALTTELNKLREAGLPTEKALEGLSKNNLEQDKLRYDFVKARSLQGAQEIDFLEIQAKAQQRLTESEQARAEINAQNAMREFANVSGISKEEHKRLITDGLILKIKEQQQQIDELILKTHGNLTDVQKHQLLILQAQIDAYNKHISAVSSVIPLEKQITDELAKQKALSEGRAQAEAMNNAAFQQSLNETLGTPRGSKQFGSASDATLTEIIARDKQKVWEIEQTFNQNAAQVASGNFSAKTERAKYQLDASAAQQELDLRNSVRGVDYTTALKQYKGDPLSFDAFYQQVNSSNQIGNATNQKLDSITGLLKNALGG